MLGVLINSQTGKDPWKHCKDYLCTSDQCWSWEGGQSTVQLGKDLHEDFARITSAPLTMLNPGGINWQSTWKGSAKTLQGLPLTVLIMGRGQSSWSSWKGSMKTLQGLPLHLWPVLILGGNQLTVNLERIHKDFARITSAPLTMLILGGLIDSQLGKDLQRHCKDYLCTFDSVDPRKGVNRQSTWKGSAKTLQGLPLESVDPGGVNWRSTRKGSMKTLQGLLLHLLINVDSGGAIESQLGKDLHEDFARITSAPLTSVDHGGITSTNVDLGVNWWSTWKGSTNTLQRLPLHLWPVLIHGMRINPQSTWKGSTKTLQGLPLHLWPCWSWGAWIDIQLGKWSAKTLQGLPLHLWLCWSWWGVNWSSTWKGTAKTLQGLPLTMLILGGVIDGSTWKQSMKTLQGLRLTMLILWGGGRTLHITMGSLCSSHSSSLVCFSKIQIICLSDQWELNVRKSVKNGAFPFIVYLFV